ncbi:MAG TPA: Uma2 family endonuclease [Longimicrobium sp.]|nr:Uma2 family endonuclease [Longimicrobium sp.]
MHTSASPSRRLFNVEEYQRLGELGILPETGTELIEGEIVVKNGRGTPHRWTYDDWVQMGEAGVLGEGERTELVNGEIVGMTPAGPRHVYVVDLLTEYLGEWARGRAILRVQSPLRFNDIEAPQPDLALLRRTEDRYRSRQAGPWDALLIVEVADSSVSRDLEKAILYARAAIPEYWLVDVNQSLVVVHLNPVGGEYVDVREYTRGESWASPALGGREVRVEDVLGPA